MLLFRRKNDIERSNFFFGSIFGYICTKVTIMLRKIIFISLAAALAIGISSASFTESQPKPAKKTVKKTKAKKPSSGEATPAAKSVEKLTWYNMTDGYAKALKEKKILVVDVYTDWCYWCKVMDKQTYENKQIVEKMKKYAVAVKFNPEVNGTHTVNGIKMNSDELASYLAKGGRIPGYPMTFLWKTLKDNSKIEPYSGYMDTTVFNAVLNKMIQE